MNDNFDPQWFALRCVTQKEYDAAGLLRKQGMATFTPTEIRTHKRSSYSRGQAQFAVPVIPGIIFAGFPGYPAWYDVFNNPHIRGAIGYDGKPMRLDFLKLLEFFCTSLDGCMVIDDGIRLIHIPGHPPVRALTTRVRTISPRKRKPRTAAEADGKLPVVTPPKRHADFLSRFVYGGMV